MIIIRQSMPNINGYSQYIYPISLSEDVSIVIIFRTLYRDDSVLVDIYKDEISESTKIISGRKLTADSLVALPNISVGFPYNLKCIDMEDTNVSLTKYNVNKFHLLFTRYDNIEG